MIGRLRSSLERRRRLSGSGMIDDGDMTIRVETVVAGQEDGSCLMPARLTADIVRSLEPGAVSVSADAEEAQKNRRLGHDEKKTRAAQRKRVAKA